LILDRNREIEVNWTTGVGDHSPRAQGAVKKRAKNPGGRLKNSFLAVTTQERHYFQPLLNIIYTTTGALRAPVVVYIESVVFWGQIAYTPAIFLSKWGFIEILAFFQTWEFENWLSPLERKLINQADDHKIWGQSRKYNMGPIQRIQAEANAENSSGPHDVGRPSAAPHHVLAISWHAGPEPFPGYENQIINTHTWSRPLFWSTQKVVLIR